MDFLLLFPVPHPLLRKVYVSAANQELYAAHYMYAGTEEPTKYRNRKTLKRDRIPQTHLSEQLFWNSLSTDLSLDCFPSTLDLSIYILVNGMLIHFQNSHIFRDCKNYTSLSLWSQLTGITEEKTRQSPPICSCCEGVCMCTNMFVFPSAPKLVSVLTFFYNQQTSASLSLLLLSFFQSGQTWIWLCFTGAVKWIETNQNTKAETAS